VKDLGPGATDLVPSDFCLALTVLRLSRGWSQDQVAKVSGLTNSALSEYERGRKMPELKSVRKIVGALGYPLSAIEKTEAFLGELRLESLVEARTKPDGGFFLTPASRIERSGDEGAATLHARARRVAAQLGQATTGFGLLLLDILITSRDERR
jgi:transcriptional regulator with XRE-family HTH domain